MNALTSLSVKTARHVPRVSIAPRRDSLRASAVPLGLACPQSAPAARAAACHVVRAASTTRRGGPSAARAHKASTQKRIRPTSARLAHRVDGARMPEPRAASSSSRVLAASTIRQKAPITGLRASLALPARPAQSQGAPIPVPVPHVHLARLPQRTAAHFAICVRQAHFRHVAATPLVSHAHQGTCASRALAQRSHVLVALTPINQSSTSSGTSAAAISASSAWLAQAALWGLPSPRTACQARLAH